MRILTIRLGAVGDVLMALPAIAALGRAFQGARIDHLVEAPAKDAIEGVSAVARTIVVPREQIAKEAKRLRFTTWRQTRQALAAEHYDLVVDFHNLLRSALWASAVPAARKVVRKNWRELSPLFFDTRVPYDRSANVIVQHMAVVQALVPETLALERIAPPLDADLAEQTLSRLGIRGGFCAVAPGSRWPGRTLPDRLVQDAIGVAKEMGLQPLLIGGAREAERFARLGAEHAIPSTTDLSLKGLAGVLARAALVVSADSAPLHYADLLNRPVVGVFGPSSPQLYGPMFAPHVSLRDATITGSAVRTRAAEASFAAIGRTHIAEAARKLVS